jgi:hypothetical protein
MKRLATGGRSQITIYNGTRCAVSVALFKRSPLHPDAPAIAWQVVSLPPRGRTAVLISRDFQVCARYSFEPENPRRPVYQTHTLQGLHAPAGAAVTIEGISTPDRRTWGAVLARTPEGPGWFRIRITNHFAIGVWAHLWQDEQDIFPPRILPPMATWTEDLSSTFYLAVLPLPHAVGDLLPESEIALTEIAVEVGEHVKIQGGPRKGFEIIRTSQGDAILVEERQLEVDVQAPRAPKVKLETQVKSKAKTRRREMSMEPAKKEPSNRRRKRSTKKAPAEPVFAGELQGNELTPGSRSQPFQ